MNTDLTSGKASFLAAVTALGSSQTEIADLAGVSRQTLSSLLSPNSPHREIRRERLMIKVCREGLMVKAALLGYGDGELLKYTEHRIFGLPDADAELLISDARRIATEKREEMYGVRA